MTQKRVINMDIITTDAERFHTEIEKLYAQGIIIKHETLADEGWE